jgi:hypothetical protein
MMKTWQLGVMGAALAIAMTACPSGRGGSPSANFPIKAGDVWGVVFSNSGGTVTVGFGLDGAPEYDEDGDIYAEFKTTKNVAGGFGYVLTQTGRFQASFVVDAAKRQNLSCFADNTGGLSSNVSGGVYENGKRLNDISCAFKRQ